MIHDTQYILRYMESLVGLRAEAEVVRRASLESPGNTGSRVSKDARVTELPGPHRLESLQGFRKFSGSQVSQSPQGSLGFPGLPVL